LLKSDLIENGVFIHFHAQMAKRMSFIS